MILPDHPDLDDDDVPTPEETASTRRDRVGDHPHDCGSGDWTPGGTCPLCTQHYDNRLAVHLPDCPER